LFTVKHLSPHLRAGKFAALPFTFGQAVPYLVEALCYKPEGGGFIPYEITGLFNLPNPSGRFTALGHLSL
jgi:hypothetical protein